MKSAVLCGIALLCSSALFAQTPPAAGASTPSTVTMTGCVGGGTSAQPITLGNAMVVPTTQPSAAVAGSPTPGAMPQPATQPPAAAAGSAGATGTTGTVPTGAAGTGVGTAGTTGAGVGTAGTTGAGVGTAGTTGAGVGTAGAAGATPTTGVAGAAGSPTASAGVSGTAAGSAPAGTSASSVSGYRLSGTDMTGWVGRRVQIVGTMVPAPAGAASTNAASAAGTTMPEFRVISVQPISGSCQPQ